MSVKNKCSECKCYKADTRATAPCDGFCLHGPPVQRVPTVPAGTFDGKFAPVETRSDWVCSLWQPIVGCEMDIPD